MKEGLQQYIIIYFKPLSFRIVCGKYIDGQPLMSNSREEQYGPLQPRLNTECVYKRLSRKRYAGMLLH